MAKGTIGTINAQGLLITVCTIAKEDYFNLTDIARYKNPDEPAIVVNNWMRLRNTVEYLGFWEKLHNPNFKPIEFDRFLQMAGTNAFTLSPHKWIAATGAIGLISKNGRNGGTFAFSDIALKFAAWLSVEFELYIIKDYQRLKTDENNRLRLDWNMKRELSKVNYKIHTDAIKNYLIPQTLSQAQIGYTYATEADLLNVALFDMTAAQWRNKNKHLPDDSNMRDYADIPQLIVLSNLESMNAELIKQGMTKGERLECLRGMAYEQLASLANSSAVQRLDNTHTANTLTMK